LARFDRLARIYDLLPIPTQPDTVRQTLADLDGPGLDLGGGTGRFTGSLHAERSPRVLADRSRGMLARARRAERSVAPILADGVDLPLADASVGAVTVTEAFHHFAPHQEAIVAELARVLRPEGGFAVQEIDPGHPIGRAIELGENVVMRFGSRFLAPEDLTAMIERHFDDVQTHDTGAFTYLVEARQPHP
jgi:ubiquinone/menaquinone biosynthesis C-methylase UbiE